MFVRFIHHIIHHTDDTASPAIAESVSMSAVPPLEIRPAMFISYSSKSAVATPFA
jgi:hypothetical protein